MVPFKTPDLTYSLALGRLARPSDSRECQARPSSPPSESMKTMSIAWGVAQGLGRRCGLSTVCALSSSTRGPRGVRGSLFRRGLRSGWRWGARRLWKNRKTGGENTRPDERYVYNPVAQPKNPPVGGLWWQWDSAAWKPPGYRKMNSSPVRCRACTQTLSRSIWISINT